MPALFRARITSIASSYASLQVLRLPLVLLAHILGLGSQGVFPAAFAVLDPAFDFRRSQIELAAGDGHRRLALDDIKDQRRLTPGSPALESLLPSFRSSASLSGRATPEQEISGSPHRRLVASGRPFQAPLLL